jgi:hypothetical protein
LSLSAAHTKSKEKYVRVGKKKTLIIEKITMIISLMLMRISFKRNTAEKLSGEIKLLGCVVDFGFILLLPGSFFSYD